MIFTCLLGMGQAITGNQEKHQSGARRASGAAALMVFSVVGVKRAHKCNKTRQNAPRFGFFRLGSKGRFFHLPRSSTADNCR